MSRFFKFGKLHVNKEGMERHLTHLTMPPLLLKMKKAPKTTTPKIKLYLRKLLPLTTQSVR